MRESHYEESLLLTTNPQEFLEHIWSTLEGWKAESTLETLFSYTDQMIELCYESICDGVFLPC